VVAFTARLDRERAEGPTPSAEPLDFSLVSRSIAKGIGPENFATDESERYEQKQSKDS
jgi:hypothetical protein